ncbi:phosphoserine aminotransferase [Zalerion maritima]|uniref:phosphoserine transaminase n=1 Tax=Zalerion maritima TaxID=339359 RepID=A0AAD5RYL6_9PEZI|nr:phosphoserine aminotransferase [Zalerion maritima]
MPAREDITYWGAGPALMPTDVLQKAAAALINYNDTGLGIAEHSHRSQHATDIINEAKADLASYLSVPTDKYEILFMQAGGSGEFSAVVYNLVGAWVQKKKAAGASDSDLQKAVLSLKCDYIVTGGWSEKSYKEAGRLLGEEHANLVADSRKSSSTGKFGSITPESDWSLTSEAAYVYYCDNETVDGVEFPAFPESLKPKADGSGPIVVADMSSNILSRPIPVENYGIIFFGAQKNFGIAGITVAIVRKDLIPQPPPALMRKLGLPIPPIMLQYDSIAKNNSLYNTLSIFDVYIAGQVLKKLLSTYPNKVAGQAEVSDKKAGIIYSALEAHPDVYKIVPAQNVRSRMNICFRVTKGADVDAAEKAFLKESTALGLTGLKGHRSVGGIRASAYNSVPLAGAEKLAAFINDFAKS